MLVFKLKYQRSTLVPTCASFAVQRGNRLTPPMSSSMPVCLSLTCWEGSGLTSQLSQAIIRRECDGSVYEAAEAGGKVSPRCGQELVLQNCWVIRMVMIYTEKAGHGIIEFVLFNVNHEIHQQFRQMFWNYRLTVFELINTACPI